MNLRTPHCTIQGLPTITVTHADGRKESLTVKNVMLKSFLDKHLTTNYSIASNVMGIVKVGRSTDPVIAGTTAIVDPIKPGSNYTSNTVRTNNVKTFPVTPDGKTRKGGKVYKSVFNLGALVGTVNEIGLDLQNRTNVADVDFKVVLDAPIVLTSETQLTVEYYVEVTLTKPDPFTVTANVLGAPTTHTFTPIWVGWEGNADAYDLKFLLGTNIAPELSPVSTWADAATNIASSSMTILGTEFDQPNATVNLICTMVPGSPAQIGDTVGFIKTYGLNSGLGYNISPPILRDRLNHTFTCDVVKEYYEYSPWYVRPTPPDPVDPPEDTPDVIPTNLVDTPNTGAVLQSLGPSGLDYPYQIVRANDEIEVLFFPGGPNYRPNTSVQVEGTEVWASSTLTPINFGFGMWGIDGSTDNMLNHYNCYVELIDGSTVKRAKLVINTDPNNPTLKWFTYAKETSPGLFSKTDYFYPEYVDLYNEYINETGGFKYAFGGGLPAVDGTYFGLNPGALWLVSMFNPAGTVWETPISGKTVTFRLKAIPKTEGKTPVQLSVDVHFDIPKPETPPAGETSTPSTGHEWTSSQVVANAPAVETRANDEVEVCFGSTNGVRTGDTWTGNGDTMDIAWGFGMYNNFNMVTEDMTDRYDFYLELVHNGVTKRAKMVKVTGIEYPWTYLQYETSPGVFGATEYIYGFESFSTSHEVSATEYNVKGEQAKGYFTTTVTGVDPELSEIEQLPFVVRAFYRDTKVLPFDIHNATLQFKVRAVPKDSAKTEVLYIATVVLT